MNPADDLNRVQAAVLRDVTDEIGQLGYYANLLHLVIVETNPPFDECMMFHVINASADQKARAYRTLTEKEIE